MVGGKAAALARLAAAGALVPPFVCVTAEACRRVVDATGLCQPIALEVHRKDFEQMYWEELWDGTSVGRY